MNPKDLGARAFAFLGRVTDWCILSAFWLLCCLPVVTIAASGASLYDTAARVLRAGRGGLKATFFAAFRRNWKQGIPLSLVFLWETYTLSGGWQIVYWLVVLLVGAIALGVLVWAFALLSRFRQKTSTLLKAAFLMAVGYPARTLGLLLALGASAFACRYIPLLLFLLPGIYGQLAARVQEPVLRKHTAAEERPTWGEDEES